MTMQQPRSRQEAKLLGLPDWQIEQMFPEQGGWSQDIDAQANRVEGGLLGSTPSSVDQSPEAQGLLAPEQERRFWRGGDKFKGKDALAGLLAFVGDTAATLGGMEGGAIDALSGQRSKALDEFKKRAEQERKMQELTARMRAAGLSDAQIDAELGGFKLPEPKGLQPVAGPTGVYVWDRDNYRFVTPPGGIPGGASSADGWVDIDEKEVKRLQGGGTGNGAGGFPFRR